MMSLGCGLSPASLSSLHCHKAAAAAAKSIQSYGKWWPLAAMISQPSHFTAQVENISFLRAAEKPSTYLPPCDSASANLHVPISGLGGASPQTAWIESLRRVVVFVLFCFVLPCHSAYGILVPWPGSKLVPPELEAHSLNHPIPREIPRRVIV